jgi:hypothetical protein
VLCCLNLCLGVHMVVSHSCTSKPYDWLVLYMQLTSPLTYFRQLHAAHLSPLPTPKLLCTACCLPHPVLGTTCLPSAPLHTNTSVHYMLLASPSPPPNSFAQCKLHCMLLTFSPPAPLLLTKCCLPAPQFCTPHAAHLSQLCTPHAALYPAACWNMRVCLPI